MKTGNGITIHNNRLLCIEVEKTIDCSELREHIQYNKKFDIVKGAYFKNYQNGDFVYLSNDKILNLINRYGLDFAEFSIVHRNGKKFLNTERK